MLCERNEKKRFVNLHERDSIIEKLYIIFHYVSFAEHLARSYIRNTLRLTRSNTKLYTNIGMFIK